MRSPPPADEELYDDPSPRVVPAGPAPRSLDGGLEVAGDRRRPEPWMPRDYPLPTPPRRAEPPTAATAGPRLTQTHRLLIAAVGAVCLAVLLGLAAWRIVNDVRRALDAPPNGGAASSSAPSQSSAVVPPGVTPEPTGTGPITMEVRVLQPNYAVAPGDTLASIARRHGTTVDALASINNLENRNSLSVSQRLIIP